MMPEPITSPRFALPLLAAGQAQKEITHNEALVLIDALMAPRVVGVNALTPPATSAIGQCWALGAAPTGVWAGQGLTLAVATSGGWRFVPQMLGASVTLDSNGEIWRRGASGWAAPALVAAASGGTVIDSECRAAVAALIAALVASGIVRTS
jgi:hypothetical protein